MARPRPLLLSLDNALATQDGFQAHAEDAAARAVEARDLGPRLRLWTRPPAFEALKQRLAADAPANRGDIVFAGSGDFHHVTLLLLARAIEAADGKPVTLVHFDNHPDWVKFDNGVHCGSWMARASRMAGVARVISVGLCSGDIDKPRSKGADLSIVADGRVEIYPFNAPGDAAALAIGDKHWPSIASLGEGAFADLLASRLNTEALYITIDKDVLTPADAVTNWDQGVTRLDFLVALIQRVCAKARLIGADIVGDWSPQRYGGTLAAALKRCEALMDQPWRAPDQAAADRVNERANIVLLDALREAGA
jgi:arginase family enzyme